MTTRNERHPVTMEAIGRANCFFDDAVNTSVLVAGYLEGVIPHDLGTKPFKQWAKLSMDRDEKMFSGIIGVSFRVGEAKQVGAKVDVAGRDLRLGKPAAGVEADFRSDQHPLYFARKPLFELLDLFIRELGFDAAGSSGDAEAEERVGVGETVPDSFVQELGEELRLEQGRVVTYCAAVNWCADAPLEIVACVIVTDLPRIDDVALGEKRSNCLPRGGVAAPAALALPMRGQILRHPCLKGWRGAWCAQALLFGRRFIGGALGFARLAGVIVAKAGAFLYPFAAVQIALAQLPKWGAFYAAQVSHVAKTSLRFPKGKSERFRFPAGRFGLYLAEACGRLLPLHHEAMIFPLRAHPVPYQFPFWVAFRALFSNAREAR